MKNQLPRIIVLNLFTNSCVDIHFGFLSPNFHFLTRKFDSRISPFHLYLTRHFCAAECTYKSIAACPVNVYVCAVML